MSIWEHAKTRGYDLVAVTHRNLVLIDQSFNAGAFKAYELHEIAHNSGYRFFFGFDGTMIRQIPALGQQDDEDFFQVPWSRTIFPQPIARPFHRFAEGSPRVLLGGVV